MVLARYILGQTVLACGLAVGLFAAVLILGNALRDLAPLVAQGQLGGWTFLQLVLLLLPFVASYALPLGILTGTLLVLGRLSAQGEVTAMRAAGIGLRALAAPIVLLALAGVVLTLAINTHYAPLARSAYRNLLADAVRADPLSFLLPRTFVRSFPGYVLYLAERDGQALRDIWIWELNERRQVVRLVRAEQGRLELDEASLTLTLVLERGQSEFRDESDPEEFRGEPPVPLSFGSASVQLPLDKILQASTRRASVSWLPFAELVAERDARRDRWRSAPTAEEARPLRAEWMKAQVLVQERLSSAFAVLSLALVAVPLGLRFGRRETSANLVVALALALSYYLLALFLGWLPGRPDLLLWIPNFIFQALGVFLWWRLGRR